VTLMRYIAHRNLWSRLLGSYGRGRKSDKDVLNSILRLHLFLHFQIL